MKPMSSTSRSRPNFRLWSLVVACLTALTSEAVFAQSSQILTIDQDRLLVETRLGASVLEALETRAKTLAAENKTIEEDLIAEELALTEKRPDLAPDEFRTLANEFDQRVQTLRAEQDDKERALNRAQEEARNTFVRESASIISEIVRERGALLVIDRRDVYLSAGSIDITDEAIKRINDAEAAQE